MYSKTCLHVVDAPSLLLKGCIRTLQVTATGRKRNNNNIHVSRGNKHNYVFPLLLNYFHDLVLNNGC